MAAEPTHPPALFGLVLSGGRSARMKRDKAALAYHGASQLDWAMQLVSRHVARAFVSLRADQTADPLRSRYPAIIDQAADLGPISGILAAQATHPEAAWLVLACDLPFVDDALLGHLRAHRDAMALATAYRSASDGLPEPLCAIYEPRSREPLLADVSAGKRCPRKFLIRSGISLLELPRAHALDNVNSAEEYWSTLGELHPSDEPRRVHVQYYAVLREQSRVSTEEVVTTARTPAELYAELARRHAFTVTQPHLRVAINAEFGDWGQPLVEGDQVVFIPPVAGG